MIYTGIGTKGVPSHIGMFITTLALVLDETSVLRSGGANGCDKAFEEGSNNKEIYLPFDNFNSNKSNLVVDKFSNYDEIRHIAKHIHPVWDKLDDFVKKLHTRNVCQILGKDLSVPSDLVICYTTDGAYNRDMVTRETGGTATAITLASSMDIPIFNLKNRGHIGTVIDLVGKDKVYETILGLSDLLDKEMLSGIMRLIE